MARADAFGIEPISFGSLAGSPDAMFELGMKYAVGREVITDLVTAHKWFNLAALKGNKAARDYRSEIARDMSRAEIATAQKLAREHLSAH